MNKIWLIAQREYISKVKSKSFILTTLLAPLGIVLFIAVLGFIMTRGSDTKKNFVIRDSSNLLKGEFDARKNLTYSFSSETLESLLSKYEQGEFDGVLDVTPLDSTAVTNHSITFYSDDRLALDEIGSIENAIERKIREFKVIALGIDEDKVALLRTNVDLSQVSVKEKDKEVSTSSTLVGGILGGIISYGLFFIIILYGGQVMRSVMEEKINRIVEVLISSVKPFQLMMGKIIGIGGVGLTQIGFWVIILLVLFPTAQMLLGSNFGSPEMATDMMVGQTEEVEAAVNDNMNKVMGVMNEIGNMNWFLILPLVIFYFLTGYLAYAAIFAAIGSAVGEDMNDVQSLTFIVMMPLIISIYVAFSAVAAPDSSLSVWGSIIPLSSSLVMPVRLPLEPPIWQVGLSVLLLIGFVLFMVWLAARIYRVGILMYGKKASFKELGKWLFYKV